MRNSDSGHNGNLTSFNLLITAVEGYSSVYNPSKKEFQAPNLRLKSAAAQQQITNHNKISGSCKVMIDKRAAVYDPLNSLVTSIFNYLKSTGGSKAAINEVGQVVRKLKGLRAGKKTIPAAQGEEQDEHKQISVSQLSFDDRLNNFDKLIYQLELIPDYLPNEAIFTLEDLRQYYMRMEAANKAVLKAKNELENAIIARNKEFYDKETGLIEIGKANKLYIKALYGPNSPEYRQVSGIAFKSFKN